MLVDPCSVPRDTDFASVIVSDVPVVVQHTRLDTRQSALALLSTVAWSARTTNQINDESNRSWTRSCTTLARG